MNEVRLTKSEGRVLAYLEENKSITVRDCFDLLGTTELRKIVSNLRRKGVDIVAESKGGLNRYGEKVNYKEYSLNG